MNDKQQGGEWARFLAPESDIGASAHYAEALEGRNVCVTGAGGFIGSAIARVAARADVRSLLLIESVEQRLLDIETELRAQHARLSLHAVLASVGDRAEMEESFDLVRPELILHAAAYKHVELLERNPFAAIDNNAGGTAALADAAAHRGVRKLVVVSTDKAVRPRSIMGASKRICELMAASLSGVCEMNSVRLVNVIGSTGSVLPIFLHQIASGMPLTVTDRNATRFFISSRQAVDAILGAANSPYNGAVHVPRVKRAVRIAALAEQIRAAHGSDAEILFTGLREGEKLEEELTYADETACGSAGEDLTAFTTPAPESHEFRTYIRRLRRYGEQRDATGLIGTVRELVPTYEPSRSVVAQQAHTVEA